MLLGPGEKGAAVLHTLSTGSTLQWYRNGRPIVLVYRLVTRLPTLAFAPPPTELK